MTTGLPAPTHTSLKINRILDIFHSLLPMLHTHRFKDWQTACFPEQPGGRWVQGYPQTLLTGTKNRRVYSENTRETDLCFGMNSHSLECGLNSFAMV